MAAGFFVCCGAGGAAGRKKPHQKWCGFGSDEICAGIGRVTGAGAACKETPWLHILNKEIFSIDLLVQLFAIGGNNFFVPEE
jgi:hypothetical protein